MACKKWITRITLKIKSTRRLMIPTLAQCDDYLDEVTNRATTIDGMAIGVAKTQVYILLNIADSLQRLVKIFENDRRNDGEINTRSD